MSQLTALHSCLILSFLSSCGNNEVLRVIQYPPDITVEEGETAHMQCCWGWGSQMEQVRLEWKNSTSKIYDHLINMRSTVYQTTSTNLAKEGKYGSSISGNCSNFSISGVSMNHAGVFICSIRAEIPYFMTGEGNGTQLTVKPRPGTDTTPQDEPPLQLDGTSHTAVLIPLAVVMGTLCLCAFLCYWRKKKQMPYPEQTSGKVGMVIHEGPHAEGEESIEQEGAMALVEHEGSSRSSQGSTQWSTVPVYESFDYFAVRTSEDR
ncbi:hypothetical protein COCON_G00114970 [Conger conger]|uniref:Ig-like domain-containing protein n=1 Tax=Conger conger TaxID=82655 RepID=A0A9Q1DGG8_CONCO|nr:hypothetical protein COCON_G00114970 [Conger conger]